LRSEKTEDSEKPKIRTGRNLPAALGVGVVLGGGVLATLLTVKATFLIYMGAAIAVGVHELSSAARTREIEIPLVPLLAATAAALTTTYWLGAKGDLATVALAVFVTAVYRLRSGTAGYVRDVSASAFAVFYLPFLASFVAAMLSHPDGARRVITFVVVTICSDIGGYFAGITLGRGTRHPMVPNISPKKTWEGTAGSAVACLLAGWLTVTNLLHGHAWQGLLLGAATVVTAITGDLIASSIKRDLGIKDFGKLLPGHGGVLDRIDSLLITAPVAWLLLEVFLPHA
jgi:phosphatidate cytidylyltransferase